MRTELGVDGADCSFCWNDVIEKLGDLDGVSNVTGSITAGCIAIEHDDIDPAALVAMVRTSLHGIAMSANEIVMSSIDPVVVISPCTHDTKAHLPSTEERTGSGPTRRR